MESRYPDGSWQRSPISVLAGVLARVLARVLAGGLAGGLGRGKEMFSTARLRRKDPGSPGTGGKTIRQGAPA